VKILFVADSNPIPVVAGNRARILNMVRELVRWGHEVHYALLNAGDSPAEHLAELEGELGRGQVHEIHVAPPHKRETIVRRGARQFLRVIRHEAGYRVRLDHFYDKSATIHLRALHEPIGFGAVIVEGVFLAKAFEAFDANVFRILDTHQAFGDRHKKPLKAGMQPLGYSTTLREEENGFRRADVVLAMQRDDEKRFRQRLGKDGDRVRTVSHIVDLTRRIEPTGAPAASFIGSMNAVNLAGLDFLLRQVMPRVREHRPDFRLFVAGPISDWVRKKKGAEACGFVSHVADLFQRAPLSLNPISISTGINIRLLEAMACGIPTVSTEKGVRGLEPTLRRGVRIVRDRDPGAFAAAILDLLENPARCRRMGADAYADAAAWNTAQRAALREVLELAALFHVGAHRRTG
jgi:polysaccharide biosynthesis protein PslH